MSGVVVKRVLSENKYAVAFLQNTLSKKISEQLDFSKLRIAKGSLIDVRDQERFTDMLFHIPHKKEHSLSVYCLVEHKSHLDKEIKRQLGAYLWALYQNKNHKEVIIPLVL